MTPSLRCLILDSDRDYLNRMRRHFETDRPGIELVIFSNSVEALDFARGQAVDLILTAYLMPQIDGLHLISSIRAFNRDVALVLISDAPMADSARMRGARCLDRSDLWAQLDFLLEEVRLIGRAACTPG